MTERAALDHALLRRLTVDVGLLNDLVVSAETGSTNADAADALRGGAPGLIGYVTDHQVAGRGRHGRPWVAPQYSQATMSLSVRLPAEAIGRLGVLPLATGLAVVDAVRDVVRDLHQQLDSGVTPPAEQPAHRVRLLTEEEKAALAEQKDETLAPRQPGDDLHTTGPKKGVYAADTLAHDADQFGDLGRLIPVLKWPNDVLIGGRKVCGILAEAVNLSDNPALVVGLGLNVSLQQSELPVAHASSLDMCARELGYELELNRTMLVASVLNRMVQRLMQYSTNDPQLVEAYRQSCSTIGSRVHVMLPGDKDLFGQAVSVDNSGELIVRDDAGEDHTVSAGDVSHVRGVSS